MQPKIWKAKEVLSLRERGFTPSLDNMYESVELKNLVNQLNIALQILNGIEKNLERLAK